MALDPDEVIVGTTGSVYLAPVGTSPPTDTVGAWPAGWVDLGYLSEDAVTSSFDSETVDIMAWQADAPIFSDVTLTQSFQFQLMQWNEDTLTWVFGGGTWTAGPPASFAAPAKAAYDAMALGIEAVMGSKIVRWGLSRVKITELGDINIKGDEAALLDVTVKVLDNAGQSPWKIVGVGAGAVALASRQRSASKAA
jgi:hypothetical protein